MISSQLPAFFISHGGGPCFWMQWDPPDMFDQLAQSLKNIPNLVGTEPRAILVISGHWEEDVFTVQSTPYPSMIYDYYGFPEHTYKLKYPAPGSPKLAKRVQELLSAAKIPNSENSTRGYDHGLFVPLMKMYPEAKIPVIQISLKKNLDPADHYALGLALAPLRDEGILIVGSGLSYHNLRQLRDDTGVSEEFDNWLTETVCSVTEEERRTALLDWLRAPAARKCHPREDHLIPLMVVAGAAHGEAAEKFYSEKMKNWKFRSSSFQFGETVKI